MDLSPDRFLRLCLAAIAFLGVPAFGSTSQQGLLLTHPAETGLELLHDNGRLVLSFCIVAFVTLHLCISMCFKAISRRRSTTSDTVSQFFTLVEADTHEDDPLALIVLGLSYWLRGSVFLLCTALAACWRGITYCFATTVHRSATAFAPSPSPSASVHPTKPPPASSSRIASSCEPELPDLRAAASSSSGGMDSPEASVTMAHQNSWLTRQNQWLSRRLEGVKGSNRNLQKQLQEAYAALLTSRSNAKSADTLAAQAIAEKQRYKAALCEMKACVEEMYVEGERAFELFHNQQEVLRELLQQERASRVQEEQTHLDQVRSLTAQLSMSQDDSSAEQQRSHKLAKLNTQLQQERDVARSTARAIAAHLKEIVIKQAKADCREKAKRHLEALSASEQAPGRPDTCRRSRTCPHSDAALQAKKQDDASSAPNINKPPGLTDSIKAETPLTRTPFSVINAKQLTVQAADRVPMSALSSPVSTLPNQSQAGSMTSDTQSAQENVAPAASGFTFGFRPITCPDAGKPLFAACAPLPVEAKPSTAKGQSFSPATEPEAHSHIKSHMFSKARQDSKLSKAALAEPPTTAPEAHSHVKSQAPSKARQDSRLSKAALAKSPPTALAADTIKAGDSEVSTTAAATAVSSTANTRHPPATATEADIIKAVDCQVSTTAATTAESSTANTRHPPATATEADNIKAGDSKVSMTAAVTAVSSTANTRHPPAKATEADNIDAVDCKVSPTGAVTAESSTANTRQPPVTATEANNRLDEADLSLMTLARHYRVKHSRMRKKVQ